MQAFSKLSFVHLVLDAIIVAFSSLFIFLSFVDTPIKLFGITAYFLIIFLSVFGFKKIYSKDDYKMADVYLQFESIAVATAISALPLLVVSFNTFSGNLFHFREMFSPFVSPSLILFTPL